MRPGMDDARAVMVLEAHVAPENWEVLVQGYRDRIAQGFPTDLIEIFLTQAVAEPELWRMVSIWSSREALDAARKSVQPLSGLAMFHAAGSEPSVSIFDVVA